MLTAVLAGVVDHPCIKHVTPEMTLRYASLASETVRAAYDDAIGKTRTKQHLLVAGQRSFVPEGVEWLHAEMIKTRVAHGYCSRHPAAGACPYANICEQVQQLRHLRRVLSSRSSWPTSWSFETTPPPGSGIRRSAATTV